MIWLTWRLHRAQLLAVAAVTAAAALVLVQAGRGIADAFQTSGLADCLAAGGGCGDLAESFMLPYDPLVFIIPLFLAVPAVLGMLWGAPLVAREFEQGTHRLAWTQTVSRRRWLLTKVGMLLGATVVAMGTLTAAITWWSAPILRAADERFLPGFFDLRGVVPVAYAVFAVSLGIAIGTVVRKTVPAVGLTLLGYGAVRVAIMFLARPRFAHAASLTYAFSDAEPRRGLQDWPVEVITVDRVGHMVGHGLSLDVNALAQVCPSLQPNGQMPSLSSIDACVREAGVMVRTVYQPGDRFWTFQWIEFGIYVALAAALIGLTLLVVRRRSA
jgi:hypothetical protein